MTGIHGESIILLASTTYEIDRRFGSILLFGVFVLFIALCVFIRNNQKHMRDEKVAEQTRVEMKENYEKLEADFQELETEHSSLSEKYEELKHSEENSKKLAYTDHLTDLPNKTAFIEKLDHIMLTLRKNETVAIMFIDLDGFKEINDTLGHSYGDELLIDVTDRLKQALDENDFLARVGGDEFVILSQNLQDISDYDEKIKKVQNVFSYPFVLAMKEFFVTISIGICIAPRDGKTSQILMKNVDSAMYAAKEIGKNTYYYYNESINKVLMEKIELQSELRNGIDKEEFELYYQPQIDLKTESIVGFEALVRWNHPTRGLLSPEEFIDLSEETGLMITIGKWVMKQACKQLKQWEVAGFGQLDMAINLSNRQFRDVGLMTTIEEIINETGLNPKHLMLEIKESVALFDTTYAMDVIAKLKDIGVGVSLDNFGTDYSSLHHLKNLPVKQLKLDKSLLSSLLDNPEEQKMLTALIALLQAMGLDVVAEGVEKEHQVESMKVAKCNKAQGYWFSTPLSGEDAEQLLKHMSEDHE